MCWLRRSRKASLVGAHRRRPFVAAWNGTALRAEKSTARQVFCQCVCRHTRKTSLAGVPNRRPSGVMRKGLPSGGSLLKNTAPPASPPGGAGTPLPIKPGSGVQTTYLEIRQERKSPGVNTGALIRRPSRLPGAPYTARERLTDAPSWLRFMARGKACVAKILR